LGAIETAAIVGAYRRPGVPHPDAPGGLADALRQVEMFLRHPVAPAAVPVGVMALVRLGDDAWPALCRAAPAVGAMAVLSRRAAGGRLRPATLVASSSVTIGLWLTGEALRARGVGGVAPWGGGDGVRVGVGLGVVALAVPWLLADFGVYAGDVPIVRRVYLSKQRLPAGAGGPAVHLGHHHGMDGALLVWTGLLLSRQIGGFRAGVGREGMTLLLAFLIVYGLARAAEDFWSEQVVKRGWVTLRLPPLVVGGKPTSGRAWGGLLGLTVVAGRWLRGGSAPRRS
jgi:hypothetical protein